MKQDSRHLRDSGRMAVLPFGAELTSEGGVSFRVWAPLRNRVEVILDNSENESNHKPLAVELRPKSDGYFSGHVPEASAGMAYRYRLDSDSYLYPDPASRFQPQGPHGPSQIIDPTKFPMDR
jgi:maltooligosyltrehalose trehalohydrolase